MNKTITIVKALSLKGAPISSSVINTVAKGIVLANDLCLLAENGGHLCFRYVHAMYNVRGTSVCVN